MMDTAKNMLAQEGDGTLLRLQQADALKATQCEDIQAVIDQWPGGWALYQNFMNKYTSGYLASLCVDTLNTIASAKNWNGHAAAAGSAMANFAAMLKEAETPANASVNFRVNRLHTSSLCGSPRGHHDNIYTEYMCAVNVDRELSFMRPERFEMDKDHIVGAFERSTRNPSISSTVDWVGKYKGCPFLYGDGKSTGGQMEGLALLNVLSTRIFGHSNMAITMHSTDSHFKICKVTYADETWQVMSGNEVKSFTAPYVTVAVDTSKRFDVTKTNSAYKSYKALPIPNDQPKHSFSGHDKDVWASLSTQVREYLRAFFDHMDVLVDLIDHLGDRNGNLEPAQLKWKAQWQQIKNPQYFHRSDREMTLGHQARWQYGAHSLTTWKKEEDDEQQQQQLSDAGSEVFEFNFTDPGEGPELEDSPFSPSKYYSPPPSAMDLQKAGATAAVLAEQQGEIVTNQLKRFLDECQRPKVDDDKLQRLINACMLQAKSDEVYSAYREISVAVHKRLSH